MENNFAYKTCAKLLMSLRTAGVNEDEALAFFAENINRMTECPPNFGSKKNNRYITYHISELWIMRGFFPKTPIMFKIVLIKGQGSQGQWNDDSGRLDWYAKVEQPRISIPSGNPSHIFITRKRIKSLMDKQMNRLLLEDRNTESLFKVEHRTPKCFSPKGCIIYNLKTRGT